MPKGADIHGNRSEQVQNATWGEGSQSARQAGAEGSHMEPWKIANQPIVRDKSRKIAHNGSRQKMTLQEFSGNFSRLSHDPKQAFFDDIIHEGNVQIL